MPTIPEPKKQWYSIQVLSNMEQKVRDNMKRRIATEEMGDHVFDILVPMERVAEVRQGKRTERSRKFFPGYVFANLHLLDEDGKVIEKSWYFVQETNGVIGFAGNRQKPVPMRQSEVENMLAQMKQQREGDAAIKIAFEVGDTVKVADGPFQSQTGRITEIDPDTGKLVVEVSIFGRETPVDLEYWQVEKSDEE